MSLLNLLDSIPVSRQSDPWRLLDLDSQGFSPAIDVHETPEQVVITAELPGVASENIKLTLKPAEGGFWLELSGKKEGRVKDQKVDWRHSETRSGSFLRAIKLPAGVEAKDVQAKHTEGVLEIIVKKKPTAPAHSNLNIPIARL